MPEGMILETDYVGWFYEDASTFSQYIHIFNSVLLTCLGGGIGPVSIKQILFGLLMNISGAVILGYVFANVLMLITEVSEKSSKKRLYIENIKFNLEENQIKKPLRKKTIEYCLFK